MRQIVAVNSSQPSPLLLQRGLDGVGEALEVLLGERADEGVLRRKMAVQRPHADTRAARDVLDLGVEAALGERRSGGDDDLLAIASSIGAQWPVNGG